LGKGAVVVEWEMSVVQLQEPARSALSFRQVRQKDQKWEDRNQQVAVVAPLAEAGESQRDRSVRVPLVQVVQEAYQIYLPVEYLAEVEVVQEAAVRVSPHSAVASQMDQSGLSPKGAQEVAS
jgi:hypothetical protein